MKKTSFFKKLKRLFYLENFKKHLEQVQNQAKAFYAKFEDRLSSEDKDLLTVFVNLQNFGKMERLILEYKYDFLPSDVKLKIFLILFRYLWI